MRSHTVSPAHWGREPFTHIHLVTLQHWGQFVLQYFVQGHFSLAEHQTYFKLFAPLKYKYDSK